MNMKERVQACLLGVLLGDALGQPVETMTAGEILEKTNGMGITDFADAIQKRLTSQSHLKAGETTDDWQLTKATAGSVIDSRGLNLEDMARKHAAAYNDSLIGWGGTTRKSVKELVRFFDSHGLEGRNPDTPVAPATAGLGAGNGVAMKVSPLPIFHFLSGGRRWSRAALAADIRKFTLLTHSDPRALYTTYAYALLMMEIMREPIFHTLQARTALERIWEELKQAKNQYGFPEGGSAIRQYEKLFDFIGNPEALTHEIGVGYLCTESVIYSLGIFATYPVNFSEALLTAVNAGLDSDTNAAMIGALIGLNCGLEVIPKKWKNFHPWYSEALEIGERLYDAARKIAS